MYGSAISALLLGLVPVTASVDLAPPAPRPTLSVSRPASLLPLLPDTRAVALRNVSASGVLVIDFESGQKVLDRGSNVARPMASLTKLMTALLIVERHGNELDRWVRVPEDVAGIEGSVAHLVPGEQYTLGDLLYALLGPSANDAAVTLALFHSGSLDAFSAAMNVRAAELGLKSTVFANPTGLDHPDQESTPQDLTWLAMFAMRYPQIADRLSQPSGDIASKSGKKLELVHTNVLLHQKSNVVAGKTGTTDEARQCLLSLVEEAGHKYLVVLLHSSDRYKDMKMILNALRV